MIIFPNAKIGELEDGSSYYAADLAKELYEYTGWRQWVEMEPIVQKWISLFHGGKLPGESEPEGGLADD